MTQVDSASKNHRITVKLRRGKYQKWYGSRCRICGQASPPLPLKLVVNWARQHNYDRHHGHLITRRNRKTKLQQQRYWAVAKQALYRLNHRPMRYISGHSVQVHCQAANCDLKSKHLHESEVKAWTRQHHLQHHSSSLRKLP